MTDPQRWTDAESDSTELEQQLVRSGQDLGMPAEQKQAIWSQIVSVLPPVAPLPSPTSATTSLASIVKALCVAGAVSGLVGGGYLLVATRGVPSRTDPAPVAASAKLELAATAPAPSLDVATRVTQLEEPQATVTATQPPPPPHVSQLREESQALIAARQALRANDAVGALRLLEQAQQRFKKGALAEEREALTIEALSKSGNRSRAATRARAFLDNYPRSPHAADVQRYVAE